MNFKNLTSVRETNNQLFLFIRETALFSQITRLDEQIKK